MNGTITRLIHVRGYGFVRDEYGEERFLKATDLIDVALWPGLREGQTLVFEPVVRANGARNGLGVTGVRTR